MKYRLPKGKGFAAFVSAALVLATSAWAEEAPSERFHMLPVENIGAPAPALEGEKIFAMVRQITDLTAAARQQDEVLWGCIAGLPCDKAITDYVQNHFTRLGLEPIDLPEIALQPQWNPTRLSLEILQEGAEPVTLDSVFMGDGSPGTPEGGITAELVWGGTGTENDLAGKDLLGKAVLMMAISKPSTFFTAARTLAPKLAERGAAFLIAIVDGSEEGQFLLPGQSGAKIPVFTVASNDGDKLRASLLDPERKPMVKGTLVVTEATGRTTRNVIGMLRGRTDDVIIVSAHMDSYFLGANDNASGLAAMLALAEHLKNQETPQKTYLFTATTGHHTHEFSPGAKQIISDLPDLIKRTLFVLNVEHIAPVGNRLWEGTARMTPGFDGRQFSNTEAPKLYSMSPNNPVLWDMVQRAVDRYGITMEQKQWLGVPGDAMPYVRAGLTTMEFIDVSHWYHSSLDAPDLISVPGLERVARAYADILAEIDAMTPGEFNGQ